MVSGRSGRGKSISIRSFSSVQLIVLSRTKSIKYVNELGGMNGTNRTEQTEIIIYEALV